MDTTTSDIPREVSDIITDLNFISRCPTNSKLNILARTYADADSKLDAFWRGQYKETGHTTIDFINSTIDHAIKICRTYTSWIELVAINVHGLSNALLNLEQVYLRIKKQSIVDKLDLIKLRINKDRFLRACQAPEPFSPVISAQLPLSIISSSPPINNNNLHTGLTPILDHTFPQDEEIDHE